MKMQIFKRDAAKLAIIDIADQLSQESVLVSARFMDSVERTLSFLASLPEIGEIWKRITRDCKEFALGKWMDSQITFYSIALSHVASN